VIDVGDGLAVALKVESHNHPSAVEPFQGAATGVGGILRDIFAMGARPIAILDSLRFGEPSTDHQRHLFAEVVAGVGHYGNCVGVANLGGEVYFEPAYEHNCLVNAMCVGLLPAARLTSAGATGVGNLLVYMGRRPAATASAAPACLPRRASTRALPTTAQRPDRRPVHGQEADRVHARAARPGATGFRCRTWARRGWPRPPRDGGRGRRRT
jgi:thiamine monophosphate kinase